MAQLAFLSDKIRGIYEAKNSDKPPYYVGFIDVVPEEGIEPPTKGL